MIFEKALAGYIEKALEKMSEEDRRKLLRALQVLTHALQSGDRVTAKNLLIAMRVPPRTIDVILDALCDASLGWEGDTAHAAPAADSQ